MALQITPLAASHRVHDFQPYIPPKTPSRFEIITLGGFLKLGHAGQAMKQRVGVTYVAEDEETGLIAGYITLALSHLAVPPITAGEELVIEHVPGVKIAMLARDNRFSGLNIGEELVQVVGMGFGMQLAQFGLCRIVWAEAIPGSLPFYEKLGFKRLSEPKPGCSTPVYFDLHPVLDALAPGVFVERDFSRPLA